MLFSFLIPQLTGLRAGLLELALVLAAFALVLGYFNLLRVHLRRITARQNILYSIVLVVTLLVTFGLWFASLLDNNPAFLDEALFRLIILPIQSALGALLAFVLAVAGFRALRIRRSVGLFLFLATAIIVVLTQPAVGLGSVLLPLRENIVDPITTGSLRGMLLGVAIGSIAVGLRILLYRDRPQSDRQ